MLKFNVFFKPQYFAYQTLSTDIECKSKYFLLQPVRDLVWNRLTLPIVALTFNKDNQRLFVSCADGTVACWERPGYKGKDVVFIPFLN